MKLSGELGWMGLFTRDHAKGAIPNGSRIVKLDGEPGDASPAGTEGEVLGSFRVPEEVRTDARRMGIRPPDAYFYFVEWANRPRSAVGLADWKIKRKDAHGGDMR